MEQVTAREIIDAITSGILAGGDPTDWDAPQFEQARSLTAKAGCVWDFDSWKNTRSALLGHGRLGGVTFPDAGESEAARYE